jgi:hypothetical protein
MNTISVGFLTQVVTVGIGSAGTEGAAGEAGAA